MADFLFVLIRRERPADIPAVTALTTAAFVRPDGDEVPVETRLLAALRSDEGWLPQLSIVAVAGDVVVGHVVCTRGYVDGTGVPGLGPISVAPAWQGRGAGHALMHAILGAADALDEPMVCLLGKPAFYRRFGFVAASELSVDAPNPAWGSYFQARLLTAGAPAPSGTFRYAAPFDDLD